MCWLLALAVSTFAVFAYQTPHFFFFFFFATLCYRRISPDGGTELVKVKSQLQDLSTDVCRLRKWSGGRYCTMDEHCSDFPGKGYCWRGAAEKTKLGTSSPECNVVTEPQISHKEVALVPAFGSNNSRVCCLARCIRRHVRRLLLLGASQGHWCSS